MLDALAPVWRHLVLIVLSALASWAATDLVPWLREQPDGWAAIAAAVVTMAAAVLTPLTRQYGVGAPSADDSGDGV